MTMRHHILVPFDASMYAEAALAWATRFAQDTQGSIEIVNVVLVPSPITLPFMDRPKPTDAALAQAREEIARAAARAPMPVKTSVLVASDIGEAIVNHARSIGASMIAMGTHGRGAIRRALLGGVAAYVLRHADCPVVTMRAPASASAVTRNGAGAVAGR
jgi:nucleotide-binding universal stress UspA family protein